MSPQNRNKPSKYKPPDTVQPIDPPSCSSLESQINNDAKTCNDLRDEINLLINGDPNANPPKPRLEDLAADCAALKDATITINPKGKEACIQYFDLLGRHNTARLAYAEGLRIFEEKRADYDKNYPKCTPPPCVKDCEVMVPKASVDPATFNISDPNTTQLTAEIAALEASIAKNLEDINFIYECEAFKKIVVETLNTYGLHPKREGIPVFNIGGPNGKTVTVTATNGRLLADARKAIFREKVKLLGCVDQAELNRLLDKARDSWKEMQRAVETALQKPLERRDALEKQTKELTQQRDDKIAKKNQLESLDFKQQRKINIYNAMTECINSNQKTTVSGMAITYKNAAIESGNEYSSLPSKPQLNKAIADSTSYNEGKTRLSVDINKIEKIVSDHFGKKVNCTPNGPTLEGGPWTYPISVSMQVVTTFNNAKANECFSKFDIPKYDYPGEDADRESIKQTVTNTISNLAQPQNSTLTCCKGAE